MINSDTIDSDVESDIDIQLSDFESDSKLESGYEADSEVEESEVEESEVKETEVEETENDSSQVSKINNTEIDIYKGLSIGNLTDETSQMTSQTTSQTTSLQCCLSDDSFKKLCKDEETIDNKPISEQLNSFIISNASEKQEDDGIDKIVDSAANLMTVWIKSPKQYPIEFVSACKLIEHSCSAVLQLLQEYFAKGQDYTILQVDINARSSSQLSFHSQLARAEVAISHATYLLTIECFKELCALVGTQMSWLLRKCFIEIERNVNLKRKIEQLKNTNCNLNATNAMPKVRPFIFNPNASTISKSSSSSSIVVNRYLVC